MKFLVHLTLLLGITAGQGQDCKPAKKPTFYAQSEVQAKQRSTCCKITGVDVADRFAKLWKINTWVTSQDWYKDAVTAIIREFPEMTLNHVAGAGFYNGNEKAGLLPSTAQVCLRYGKVGGAGNDDIKSGIGYYHFNRISVATMTSAPNFPLVAGKVEYFISPLILLERHFIACDGNIAKNRPSTCPGKMESRDFNLKKPEKMKQKALDAIEKLHKMLKDKDGPPMANEVAIFGGVSFDHICETVCLEDVEEDKPFTKVDANALRSTIKCSPDDIASVLAPPTTEESAEEEVLIEPDAVVEDPDKKFDGIPMEGDENSAGEENARFASKQSLRANSGSGGTDTFAKLDRVNEILTKEMNVLD